MVKGIIAGGPDAILAAQEGAEDDPAAGAAPWMRTSGDDAVVGVAASGRTPFVIGALRAARARGALTVAVSCNLDAPISREAELAIEIPVGPEVLAGSTRLKAGTAQKLVLNMISTIAMVRLGKTWGNLMVDLRATNEKLRERAIRIVQQVTGASREAARRPAGGRLGGQARGPDGRAGLDIPSAAAAGPRRSPAGRAEGGRMKVLGMISGTSHDGIDVAVVDFARGGRGSTAGCSTPIPCPTPPALREHLVRDPAARPAALRRCCELDTRIGQAFAEVAADAIAASGPVDLICSHGQTVFHWVEGAHALGTLQLGEPAWIAERTGMPVVSDVRARDITVGGHGAPLASLMDVLLLGGLPGAPAALNLGGISNMTVLRGSDGRRRSRSTSDRRTRSSTPRCDGSPAARRPTTPTAALGAAGHVDDAAARGAAGRAVLRRCRAQVDGQGAVQCRLPRCHPGAAPGAGWAGPGRHAHRAHRADGGRCGGRRTAWTRWSCSGGGCDNPTLMAMLRRAAHGVDVRFIQRVRGADRHQGGDLLRAHRVAHRAWPAGRHPGCTGAREARVLGAITPGARPAAAAGAADRGAARAPAGAGAR